MKNDNRNKKKISFSDISKKLNRSMSENEIKNQSLEEICDYLEIDEKSQQRISQLPFQKIKASYDEAHFFEDIIKLEDLEGVTLRELTYNSWNWLKQLEEIRFYKIKNQSNSPQEMIKYLNDYALSQKDDLPIVIKHNEKYFIDEGLHRLTIAKCIGVEKFKVLIYKAKSSEMKYLKKNS